MKCKGCAYWREIKGSSVWLGQKENLWCCHYAIVKGVLRNQSAEECTYYEKAEDVPKWKPSLHNVSIHARTNDFKEKMNYGSETIDEPIKPNHKCIICGEVLLDDDAIYCEDCKPRS